jgi:hypothetical protein
MARFTRLMLDQSHQAAWSPLACGMRPLLDRQRDDHFWPSLCENAEFQEVGEDFSHSALVLSISRTTACLHSLARSTLPGCPLPLREGAQMFSRSLDLKDTVDDAGLPLMTG